MLALLSLRLLHPTHGGSLSFVYAMPIMSGQRPALKPFAEYRSNIDKLVAVVDVVEDGREELAIIRLSLVVTRRFLFALPIHP
jgi:hypothetical protein